MDRGDDVHDQTGERHRDLRKSAEQDRPDDRQRLAHEGCQQIHEREPRALYVQHAQRRKQQAQ